MRIYVKNPGRFAKYKGEVVLTHFQDTNNTIIRDNDGDIHRVANEKLEGLSIIELNEALETDTSLREVAEIEDYVIVGDYNNDDIAYMNYASSYQ